MTPAWREQDLIDRLLGPIRQTLAETGIVDEVPVAGQYVDAVVDNEAAVTGEQRQSPLSLGDNHLTVGSQDRSADDQATTGSRAIEPALIEGNRAPPAAIELTDSGSQITTDQSSVERPGERLLWQAPSPPTMPVPPAGAASTEHHQPEAKPSIVPAVGQTTGLAATVAQTGSQDQYRPNATRGSEQAAEGVFSVPAQGDHAAGSSRSARNTVLEAGSAPVAPSSAPQTTTANFSVPARGDHAAGSKRSARNTAPETGSAPVAPSSAPQTTTADAAQSTPAAPAASSTPVGLAVRTSTVGNQVAEVIPVVTSTALPDTDPTQTPQLVATTPIADHQNTRPTIPDGNRSTTPPAPSDDPIATDLTASASPATVHPQPTPAGPTASSDNQTVASTTPAQIALRVPIYRAVSPDSDTVPPSVATAGSFGSGVSGTPAGLGLPDGTPAVPCLPAETRNRKTTVPVAAQTAPANDVSTSLIASTNTKTMTGQAPAFSLHSSAAVTDPTGTTSEASRPVFTPNPQPDSNPLAAWQRRQELETVITDLLAAGARRHGIEV